MKTTLIIACALLVCLTRSQAQNKAILSRDVSLNWENIAASLAKTQIKVTPSAQIQPVLINLPLPDGQERLFKVEESTIMSEEFAALYPTFKTYSVIAADNPQVSGRMSVTPYGVNAFIFTENGILNIRPRDLMNPEVHQVYYGNDETPTLTGNCQFDESLVIQNKKTSPRSVLAISNGATRRTFNLAIVTTGEFTAQNGGTASSASAVVLASVNAIQAIYDRELSVRFTLLTPVTYLNAATDPFISDGSGGDSRPNQAAEVVAINFTSASYDIGHVLHNTSAGGNTWSGGGVAGLGVVCSNNTFFSTQISASNPNEDDGKSGPDKGAGWSGSFNNTSSGWYGLFAHEVGHQFNMTHTFNGNGGSCTAAISSTTAYEIGSGTSLMAYNGICGAAQNITSGGTADQYFHANSLDAAVTFINSTTCQTSVTTGNTPPVVVANPCGGATTIPMNTPFTLTGSGTDANGDVIYYSWEEYDEDGVGIPTQGFIGATAAASTVAPLFRSFPPTTSPSRTFPQLSSVIANAYATDFEPLPTVARTLNFRLTGRDYNTNGGGIHSVDMSVTVSGAAFSVTAPNGGETLSAGGTTTVTWNVGGTVGYCTSVNIKLSIDGGLTYPYTLASGTANDGTEVVSLPAGITNTSSARIKVESATNICVVFFDISNANLSITSGCIAGSSNICPATDASFAVGNAGLALSLTNSFGGSITSNTFSVATTDGSRNIGTYNITSTGCDLPGFNNRFKTLAITVGTSGSYSFSLSGSGSFPGISIYTASAYSSSNACNGFIASNYRHNGGGNVTIFSSVTATLNACTSYIIVGTDLNATAPFTTNISISGPGTIYTDGASPGANYAYTYLAVNTTDNQIKTISSTANFTSLPVGVYNIYGGSYNTSVNTSAWINQTISQVLSSGNCALFSSNFKKVTVTTALPVELLYLQATPVNTAVQVTWQTASEINNKGFQIERLNALGNNWDILGFVQAQNKASSYTFTDNTPLNISYYRLRQIDIDGSETYSKIVSVSMESSNTLRVYPNPVADVLTLENATGSDLHVLNLLGQEVISSQSSLGTQRINVSALPHGIYFLKVGEEQVKFTRQ